MPLVPDQHAIKAFPPQRFDQSLHVGRGVGSSVGSRNSSEAHPLKEPHIERASARNSPPRLFDLDRAPKLAVLPVVVVDQELGQLLLETRVPYLLHPLDRRVLSHVDVDDLTARELHDDEHVGKHENGRYAAQRNRKTRWPLTGSSRMSATPANP